MKLASILLVGMPGMLGQFLAGIRGWFYDNPECYSK